MRRHRGGLTLERFEQEIRDADLTGAARRLADDRIALARPYINDSTSLASLLRPGRTIIVDLRDEWIEKDEALGLFVVMMRIFAASRHQGREFNKLVVFDEAHKYITESELIGQVVETIREMRHQATSVLIASQDPLSVPRAVVELTSLLILHRMTSPAVAEAPEERDLRPWRASRRATSPGCSRARPWSGPSGPPTSGSRRGPRR